MQTKPFEYRTTTDHLSDQYSVWLKMIHNSINNSSWKQIIATFQRYFWLSIIDIKMSNYSGGTNNEHVQILDGQWYSVFWLLSVFLWSAILLVKMVAILFLEWHCCERVIAHDVIEIGTIQNQTFKMFRFRMAFGFEHSVFEPLLFSLY